MAEALAAIGGAASILSIIDVLARSIGTIGDLRQEWETADLRVLDLLTQLKAIRAALTEIHRWTNSDAGLEPHHQLQMDLDDSVTWCSILAEMIDKLLSDLGYNPDETLNRSSKAKLLFASKEMEDLQKMIDRQANALNLLISACRLPTVLEQKGLLERSSSRKVLKKLADDSASLIVHRDSSSLFTYYTDNQSKLSRTFNFDLEVFNSKAYERAIRGALKTVVRKHRGELEAVQARNAEIERRLRIDRKRQHRELKMLLLGTDSSVISGFLKQMRLIHAGGFSQFERQEWRSVLFNNLVMAFQIVFDIMTDLRIDFEIDDSKRLAASITSDLEISPNESLPLWALRAFHALWQDKGVQLALMNGNEYALPNNLEYFMQDIDRLFVPDYLPSDQDILRTTPRSTGLQEASFDLGYFTYRMFHISGQGSNRKKWIRVFDNVPMVLFFAPLHGYDLASVEDRDSNQMHEALMLFESTANSVHFEKSRIILFLSDVHRFRAKIESGLSPVQRYFPDYEGKSHDVTASQEFFADKFKSLVRDASKEVQIHYVSVQDTDILKRIMNSVQEMLIQLTLDMMIII